MTKEIGMAEDITGMSDAGFSARGSDRLTRPVVSGSRILATAGTPLTTAAAIRVLSRGGNAIDAGVAAAIAAAVVEPPVEDAVTTESYSLPTEVVGLIYDAKTQRVIALNGQGCAPSKMTIEFFQSRDKKLIPVGPGVDSPLSFTLPGTIDAWVIAVERYGRLSFAEVLEPALDYADNGFPMYRYMSLLLKSPEIARQFEFFPQGAAYFHPHGRAPELVSGSSRRIWRRCSKRCCGPKRALVARGERRGCKRHVMPSIWETSLTPS
jgi:gamma-glutamyltranspeptidase / glutathione hydrolase